MRLDLNLIKQEGHFYVWKIAKSINQNGIY
jgi:hypothetical protein